MMMIIDFITFDSTLVPLIEVLSNSDHTGYHDLGNWGGAARKDNLIKSAKTISSRAQRQSHQERKDNLIKSGGYMVNEHDKL